MKHIKNKLKVSGAGLLLGVSIFSIASSAALLIASLAFDLGIVSLLNATGFAATLLGPIGLGVVLGVGVIALAFSSLSLHYNRRYVEPEERFSPDDVDKHVVSDGMQRLGFGKAKEKTSSFNAGAASDAVIGVSSALLAASGVAAVTVVSAFALLSGVGLWLSLAASAACLLIPFVKLGVQAVIYRDKAVVPAKVNIFAPPRASFYDAECYSTDPYGPVPIKLVSGGHQLQASVSRAYSPGFFAVPESGTPAPTPYERAMKVFGFSSKTA